jgi:hypothetical protein
MLIFYHACMSWVCHFQIIDSVLEVLFFRHPKNINKQFFYQFFFFHKQSQREIRFKEIFFCSGARKLQTHSNFSAATRSLQLSNTTRHPLCRIRFKTHKALVLGLKNLNFKNGIRTIQNLFFSF